MRLLLLLSLFVFITACASADVNIDANTGLVTETGETGLESASGDTKSLKNSTQYCHTGRCSNTQVLIMVIGIDNTIKVSFSEAAIIKGFIVAGWTQYDGRLKPGGPKYLSYRDQTGKLICQGYYDWSGFGTTSDAKLRCFEDSIQVTGKIRTIGRQTKGPHKGKGMGTGLMSFKDGMVAIIYGIDPSDLKQNTFKKMWIKYGGTYSEIPSQTPKKVKKAPLLNKGKSA